MISDPSESDVEDCPHPPFVPPPPLSSSHVDEQQAMDLLVANRKSLESISVSASASSYKRMRPMYSYGDELPEDTWKGYKETMKWQQEESKEAVNQRGDLSEFVELASNEIYELSGSISRDATLQNASKEFLSSVIENEVVFESHEGAKVDLDKNVKRELSMDFTRKIKEFMISQFELGFAAFGWEYDAKHFVRVYLLDIRQFRVFYKHTKNSQPIFKYVRRDRPRTNRDENTAVYDRAIWTPGLNGGTYISQYPIMDKLSTTGSNDRTKLEIVPGVETFCHDTFRPDPVTGELNSIAKLCLQKKIDLEIRKKNRIIAELRNANRPLVTTESAIPYQDRSSGPIKSMQELQRDNLAELMKQYTMLRKRTANGELSSIINGHATVSTSTSSVSDTGMGSGMNFVNGSTEKLSKIEPHMIQLPINRNFQELGLAGIPQGIEDEEDRYRSEVAELFGIPKNTMDHQSSQKNLAELQNTVIKKKLAAHQRYLVMVLEYWFTKAYGSLLVQSLLELHAEDHPGEPIPDEKTLNAYRKQRVRLITTPEPAIVMELVKMGAMKIPYFKEYLEKYFHIDPNGINDVFKPPQIEYIPPNDGAKKPVGGTKRKLK